MKKKWGVMKGIIDKTHRYNKSGVPRKHMFYNLNYVL